MTRISARLTLAVFSIALVAPATAETLLVGNKGEDTVSFIDLASGTERARIPTGKAPHEIAISPNGKQAAVVAYGGTTIDILDVKSAKLVKRIDLAPNATPHGIVWLRNGRIVAAAEKSKSVVIVDPRQGSVASVSTDQMGSHMLVTSPDQRTAYVANIASGTISVIDLRKKKKLTDIAVGGYPEAIAITRDGKQLWAGDHSKPHVRVVDAATGKIIDTLPIRSSAIRIVISPDGKTAITSNFGSGTLDLFDVATRKPLRVIEVSGSGKALQITLAFSRDGKRLFVAETMANVIAEVDLASGAVVRRLPAGKNGDGLAIAP